MFSCRCIEAISPHVETIDPLRLEKADKRLMVENKPEELGCEKGQPASEGEAPQRPQVNIATVGKTNEHHMISAMD
jgi:hypothetical protein